MNNKIKKILDKIDFDLIHKYHRKLNILWDIEIDGRIETRVPEPEEIKEELKTLLEYFFEYEFESYSYGNWLIFWEPNAVIPKVVFKLFETNSEFNNNNLKNLNSFAAEVLYNKMQKALQEENYELCAKIQKHMSGDLKSNYKQ